ncbi:MAG: glycyl-radical enzyme activating protein [Defluviitaleaceae bacterium]|nr:glycyl-radical enzyme activating protein [Defluviitaleaceae bacterium]
MIGTILSIERCSLHDGPGLRTTVFLKGCPLSCLWCHNPESQSFKPELFFLEEKCARCGACGDICKNHFFADSHTINRADCNACGKCAEVCHKSAIEIKGIKMKAHDVMDVVLKDACYYEHSGGGLTISGGEPLAQLDFTLSLLRMAKESGIHTCLETSGYMDTDKLLSLVPYVDLFLYDFKASNDDAHKRFTSVSQQLIMDNLFAIDKAGAKIILRCPIIPTCNDNAEHFYAIAGTANTLNNILEINIMPYHPMGSSKATRIGQEYLMPDIGFPADEQVNDWVNAIRRDTNIAVKIG